MGSPARPTFDLVVATVDRTTELDRLLSSLSAQTHDSFRVLIVDQNPDDRLSPVLDRHRQLALLHVRGTRGLSVARNAALPHLDADIVAFPDDDCSYPPGVLAHVAQVLVDRPGLAGITGRAVDGRGVSSPSWRLDAARLDDENLWNRAVSFTIFLRRDVVACVGEFDPGLGLGAPHPWSSGEEVDYLVRAVRAGFDVEYDPTLTVVHPAKPLSPSQLRATGYRDGASIGYILSKHGYPPGTVARMLARPLGGAALTLARGDLAGARFHGATLQGRITGLRAARRTARRADRARR